MRKCLAVGVSYAPNEHIGTGTLVEDRRADFSEARRVAGLLKSVFFRHPKTRPPGKWFVFPGTRIRFS
jgi:hypothetical protein